MVAAGTAWHGDVAAYLAFRNYDWLFLNSRTLEKLAQPKDTENMIEKLNMIYSEGKQDSIALLPVADTHHHHPLPVSYAFRLT